MLREELNQSLKSAMKAKDARTVATVRLILAALKYRDIAARGDGNMEGISEDAILALLQAMIKQRRESIEMYQKGGRPELAQQEADEIGVIERFMPSPLSDAETTAAIDAAIAETSAATLKDIGRVMAILKAKYAGRMDFSKAGPAVKAKLS